MEKFHPPPKTWLFIGEIDCEALEPISISRRHPLDLPSPGRVPRRRKAMEIEMKKRAVSEAQSVFATLNDRTSIDDSHRHYTCLNSFFDE